MAKGNKNGQMARFMKVNGLKINHMGMVNWFMQMEISMMENGNKIKQTEWEFMFM